MLGLGTDTGGVFVTGSDVRIARNRIHDHAIGIHVRGTSGSPASGGSAASANSGCHVAPIVIGEGISEKSVTN